MTNTCQLIHDVVKQIRRGRWRPTGRSPRSNEQIALLKADGIDFVDDTHVDMKRLQWRPE